MSLGKTGKWEKTGKGGKPEREHDLEVIRTPVFTAALITIAKTEKQPEYPLMDRENAVFIYNRIIFSHAKKEILPFATTWINLEGIMLSEINQAEKDKYCMVSLTCRI